MSTTAGEIPTIPPSDDHRDGSWIATDVYIGEPFFNSADGLLYIRDENDNINVYGGGIPGVGNVKRYLAHIVQTGTSAPTVTEYINELGGDLTYYYNDVGAYYAESLTSGIFPSGRTRIIPPFSDKPYDTVNDTKFNVFTYSTEAFAIASFSIDPTTGNYTATDGLLTGGSGHWIEILVYPALPVS